MTPKNQLGKIGEKQIDIAKVLIIEDDEATLIALSEALIDEGFICRPFVDPNDAIKYALEHDDYVAIVSDIKMPGMTGLELIDELRKGPEPMCTTPVIFVSGNATKDDIQEALRLGASKFLDKPINVDDLIFTLRNIAKETMNSLVDASDVEDNGPDDENRQLIELLAHETRTPLNAVIGFSSLLLEPNLKYEPTDILMMAKLINEAGEELIKKVNLILGTMATSVESGPDVEPTLAQQVISETLERAEIQARSEGKVLTVDNQTGNRLWHINPRGTADALEQIVLNAIKYTPETTEILISAKCGNDELLLEVSDRGVGMSKKQAIRALNMFSKSDPSKIAIDNGLGLGLPFAKRKIEMQKGKLQIRSSERGGTMVRMAIPDAHFVA